MHPGINSMVRRFALAALLAAPAAAPVPPISPPAQAAMAGVLPQLPGVYRFTVGEVRVTVLSDGTVPQDLHKLLLGATTDRIDALLAEGFLANPVEASINVFLIELGDRRVLVDVGSGNLFGPGLGGKLMESLAASGFRPEQITDILVTHVHTDHTGGLEKDGARVFPNATLHVGKPDVDFFMDPSNSGRTNYDMRYFVQGAKSLKPYLDAGKVKPFAETSEVLPGITASLHPGHTPGTAFYTLESGGQRIVFIGDIIHVAAVQFPQPEISIVYDLDPKKAAEVRGEAFPQFVRDRVLLAAPHLPFPGVGHVRAAAERGFAWVPVDYANRSPN